MRRKHSSCLQNKGHFKKACKDKTVWEQQAVLANKYIFSEERRGCADLSTSHTGCHRVKMEPWYRFPAWSSWSCGEGSGAECYQEFVWIQNFSDEQMKEVKMWLGWPGSPVQAKLSDWLQGDWAILSFWQAGGISTFDGKYRQKCACGGRGWQKTDRRNQVEEMDKGTPGVVFMRNFINSISYFQF